MDVAAEGKNTCQGALEEGRKSANAESVCLKRSLQFKAHLGSIEFFVALSIGLRKYFCLFSNSFETGMISGDALSETRKKSNGKKKRHHVPRKTPVYTSQQNIYNAEKKQ